jgi:hypothetical protein
VFRVEGEGEEAGLVGVSTSAGSRISIPAVRRPLAATRAASPSNWNAVASNQGDPRLRRQVNERRLRLVLPFLAEALAGDLILDHLVELVIEVPGDDLVVVLAFPLVVQETLGVLVLSARWTR